MAGFITADEGLDLSTVRGKSFFSISYTSHVSLTGVLQTDIKDIGLSGLDVSTGKHLVRLSISADKTGSYASTCVIMACYCYNNQLPDMTIEHVVGADTASWVQPIPPFSTPLIPIPVNHFYTTGSKDVLHRTYIIEAPIHCTSATIGLSFLGDAGVDTVVQVTVEDIAVPYAS